MPQNSAALAADGSLFGSVYEENRICVSLSGIAAPVVRVLVAVEDRRFFAHSGIDFRAVVRAASVNLRSLRIRQGGSTITQQLARMAILRRADRTLRRKIVEMLTAIQLERQLTKWEILEAYLNSAYFGHRVYGIEMAALSFFGKRAVSLNESEAAYLIALLKAPARYCHCCNPEASEQRARLVSRLAGTEDYRLPKSATKRRFAPRKKRSDDFPLTSGYISDYVRKHLREMVPHDFPSKRLVVDLNLDPQCQSAVEQACRGALDQGYRGRLACVVIDARSGAVRALAGGIDHQQHNFNAATDGNLQPGSLMKPFILLVALLNGIQLEQEYDSRPLKIKMGKSGDWTVRNAANRYYGKLSIADALIYSDNTVFSQLLLDIGIERFASFLGTLGISPRRLTYAVATGAMSPGTSPLQLCSAYSVFSRPGLFFQSNLVRAVRDERGTVLWQSATESKRICPIPPATKVREVLNRATAEGTAILPTKVEGLCAKTGTSISGGWYSSFNDAYRVLTWTESDFPGTGIVQHPRKGVSAKILAARIWDLLRQPRISFNQLYSVFTGVETMSVRDLLWVEDQFQTA